MFPDGVEALGKFRYLKLRIAVENLGEFRYWTFGLPPFSFFLCSAHHAHALFVYEIQSRLPPSQRA